VWCSNGIRSAARGRVYRCPARAAAAVSAADPTFRPEYSAHWFVKLKVWILEHLHLEWLTFCKVINVLYVSIHTAQCFHHCFLKNFHLLHIFPNVFWSFVYPKISYHNQDTHEPLYQDPVHYRSKDGLLIENRFCHNAGKFHNFKFMHSCNMMFQSGCGIESLNIGTLEQSIFGTIYLWSNNLFVNLSTHCRFQYILLNISIIVSWKISLSFTYFLKCFLKFCLSRNFLSQPGHSWATLSRPCTLHVKRWAFNRE